VRPLPILLTLAGTARAALVSRTRQLGALTPQELEVAAALRRHVDAIASEPHNIAHYGALQRAAAYIETQLQHAGYTPMRQSFLVGAHDVANIEAEHPAARAANGKRVVVFGAHYDSAGTTPGANDNGSGVAALLELARVTAKSPAGKAAVRFVAFVNEEPPYFMTDAMGSAVYAARCAARGEDVVAMLSLETIGYYSNEPGSQQYPPPFHRVFPRRGNFLAMVSNFRSAAVLGRTARAFRRATTLPVIAAPAPESVPGVGWSDHAAFWRHGFPALMLTDTAPYRYPHYHTREDTPEKLDYERIARVVTGCSAVIRALS
jgi:Peptidase family M28